MRRRRTRTRLLHALAAGGAVSALAACGAGPEARPAAPAPLVEALPAREGALPAEETLPGVVRARDQVAIRPEIEARVVEVLARSGETVRRGQPLVRLDDSETRERLRQAEAEVRLAEAAAEAARARAAEAASRVERSRALAAEGLLSAQELETAEAQRAALAAGADESAARVEVARATAAERRSALDKTVVRSPLAGRLGERRVEAGMLVDPSTVLFVAGGLAALVVEIDLSEEMLRRVGEGMPARIVPRGPDAGRIDATLTRISPFLAAESFTTRGEIDVDNRDGRLRPGMFVEVSLRVGESARATLVPRAALWERPQTGALGVYALADAAGLAEPERGAGEAAEAPHSAEFRPVEVIAEGRGVAAVRGVAAGQWVVTIGQQLLGSPGAGDEPAAARVRPVSWRRVLELQNLQDEDLLAGFLDKQRKVAAALGAEIPASEAEVERVLEAADADPPAGGGDG